MEEFQRAYAKKPDPPASCNGSVSTVASRVTRDRISEPTGPGV